MHVYKYSPPRNSNSASASVHSNKINASPAMPISSPVQNHASPKPSSPPHQKSLGLGLELTHDLKAAEDSVAKVNSDVVRLLRQNTKRGREGDERIEWLRSQVIGKDVEIDTSFGKRFLTYADHTASGRGLQYIEDYIVEKVLPLYGNTHTDDSFVGAKTTKLSHKASEFIKKCMGGGQDEAIMFCGAGTTAAIKRLQEVMGIAVSPIMRERLLAMLSDEERWVVFIGPYEHHSNILSWRQSLAEVVEIGLNEDDLIDMEQLKRELESPRFANRPMLGSFSACSNVTGIITDTRALARLLHEHGAYACFDFAASGPYVQIDMKSGEIDGYDAVYVSPHKFIGGPGTPGILLMNKALYQLRSLPPSTCGGGTVDYVNGFNEEDTIYYDNIEEREDAGTPPIIQKIRASLAFWVKEYVGCELIDIYESFYIETALRRLHPNPNIRILGNTSVERLAILSFLIYLPSPNASSGHSQDWDKRGKPLNGRFVTKLLNDLFGIQARGGCACAGPYGHSLLGVDENLSLGIRSVIEKGYTGMKPGWTRVSFSYYMSKEEFAFMLAAIEFIAMYGYRFLPLYSFEWKTGDWTFRKRAFKHIQMEEELAHAARGLSLTNTTTAMSATQKSSSIMETRSGGRRDLMTAGLTSRFADYLEKAKHIALSLPAEPTSVEMPEEIVLTMRPYIGN